MAVDLPEGLKIKDDELIECLYQHTKKIKEITDGYKVLIKLMSQAFENQRKIAEGFKEIWEQLDGMENYLANSLKQMRGGDIRRRHKNIL